VNDSSLISRSLGKVVTKGDLEVTKLALQKEIEQVRASIVKWVAGLLVVQTGVIISVISLLR